MTVVSRLIGVLREQIEINDPFLGRVGPTRVEAESLAWPANAAWASVELVSITEQGTRRVEEYLYWSAADGSIQPIGIAFESGPGGSHARLYGNHKWVESRDLGLSVDARIVPPLGSDIIGRYLVALKNADLESLMGCWSENGYLQHSYGVVHKGHAQLREAFEKFFEAGAIVLKYCTMTDDGRTCVFEAVMPHGRTALAVYERGAGDTLAAARLYL